MDNENEFDHCSYDPEFDNNNYGFRNPGGRSALRKGKRSYPCPTCKRENMLSQADKDRGYQCDYCADAAEGCGFAGEY